MKLFRQAYEQDNGLPIGFTEVEYLESTGTQWIDLGLKGKDGYDFDYKFNSTRIDGTAYGIGGEWESDKSCYLGLIRNTNKFAYHYGGTQSPVEVQTLTANTDYRVQAHLYSGEQYYILNGTKSAVGRLSGNFTSSSKMRLFSIYSSTPLYSYIKIYYCKIYDNGVLVRDFIPCIDPLGVPCMYDLVSKKAYYNQGTGEDFTVGRHIIPVEYLESKGTQYIDTGLRLTQNNAIEVCYKINSISGFSGVVGARTTASSNNISVNANIGGSSSPFISVDFNNSAFETYRARYDTTTSDKILAYLDKHIRKISINNSVVVSNNTECNDTIKTQSNCLLFRAPGINGYCDLSVYYCKIWDGDTLICDYIPAIDENGVAFMFDRVTHTAYLNAGSGNFTYGENATKYKTRLGFVRQMGGALRRLPKGFTEVEYLESTGTQWIDTGLKVNSNTTLQSIAETTSYPSSGEAAAPIGARSPERPTIVYGAPQGTRGNTDVFWVCWGEIAYNAQYKKNIIDGQFHEHKINNKGFYLDGTLVYALTSTSTISTSTQNIGLFARPGANGVAERFGNYKMKSAKILDNDILVRDYIPCLDASDTPCMYDIVEGKAYYNKGTGTFLYGEKKPARYLATPKVRLEIPAIYKKLNYLESTGTQYINTGIIGTNANIGIDVDWVFSNNNTNMCIFSSRSGQTSYTFTLFWLKAVSNRMRFDGVNQQYFTEGVNASVSGDIFNFNYKSKTGAVATLTNKTTGQAQTYTIGKLETFSTNPLYLFASRDTAEVYSWIKMYGCKIYDGDIVIRDFIPVLRKSDNKPGMYDKVNQIFYVNAASGVDFNYG